LEDDLAREEFKEKVLLMNRNHIAKNSDLSTWSVEKENYLKVQEKVESIADAQTCLIVLEGYEKEKVSMTNQNFSQFKKLGAEILAQKYETSFSKYVFENPSEVTQRESEIDARWNLLSTLSAEKKKVLDADLARELEKERLRLLFAQLASEFTRWTRELIDNMDTTHFGFSLEEVEGFGTILSTEDKAFRGESDQKKAQYESVWEEMNKMKVKENIYTQHTPDTLGESRKTFEASTKNRQEKI